VGSKEGEIEKARGERLISPIVENWGTEIKDLRMEWEWIYEGGVYSKVEI